MSSSSCFDELSTNGKLLVTQSFKNPFALSTPVLSVVEGSKGHH
jgi:hypothetical protein